MYKQDKTDSNDINKAEAWKFIILVGVVSLFSDMTYEGAQSPSIDSLPLYRPIRTIGDIIKISG
ncbi:MAG: hypothetical protein NTY36_00795 [Deltaproteobacteria bacterium]|nr:hypothetical protein [Deltaproteobacteria bacterium]